MSSDVDILLATFKPKPALIRRAIRSVVDQTYENWTLHIIQDGVEDLTHLIDKPEDARFRVLSIPHQGKAAALNRALAESRAKYIAYLDDDDIWYPNHLDVAVSAMRQGGIRFVHTDADEVFLRWAEGEYREISRNVLNRGPLSDLLLWYVSHVNTVHERSLIEETGSYDERRQVFVDWDMLLRMARVARPHHIPVMTCEHYIYLDADSGKGNTISKIHSIEPEYSRAMHDEMFARAFEGVSTRDMLRALPDRQFRSHAIRYWLRKYL